MEGVGSRLGGGLFHAPVELQPAEGTSAGHDAGGAGRPADSSGHEADSLLTNIGKGTGGRGKDEDVSPGAPEGPAADSPHACARAGDGGTQHGGSKVTVVGIGQVGMAAAFSILNQGLCSSLALVDINADKLAAEAADLRHGSMFTHHVRITASTDYVVSAGSDVVVVTAGVRQRPGESRLSLVDRNIAVFSKIVPSIVKYSPDACIVVVANPADVMAAVTARLAGLPAGRVFGSGTSLDSSRLRTMVAETLDVDPRSVHGCIIGEHGDSSVPVWSSLSAGGVPLAHRGEAGRVTLAGSATELDGVHERVVRAAYDVIEKKGYTNWAIGLAVAAIVGAIVNDENRIIPVSTCVRGLHGIEDDVFLSLPAVVGRRGVVKVIELPLWETEAAALRTSAARLWDIQRAAWATLDE